MLAVLALLPFLLLALAAPSPLHKRFTKAYIVSGRTGRCLSTNPAGGVGAPVNLVDCATATQWDINPGSGSVLLSGTQFALDAGVNPSNFGRLKIWTSYPGLFQQTWFLTGDNRIAITGGNQCLDDDGTNVQTYQCTTGNTNQVWYINAAPPPPNGIPPGTVYPDPPNAGRRLHPYQRNDLCLTAVNGGNADGDPVAVTYCFPNNSTDVVNQLWDVPAKGSAGLVKLHTKNFCFDAGSNPANGIGMKVWTCYNGLFQQTWTYSNDNKLFLSNNQCVDVKQESGTRTAPPYNSLKDVQTWQCYAGNANQVFTLNP